MSGNDQMGVDGFKYLGNIVNNCSIEQLDISECNPSGEEIHSFKTSVGVAKVKYAHAFVKNLICLEIIKQQLPSVLHCTVKQNKNG